MRYLLTLISVLTLSSTHLIADENQLLFFVEDDCARCEKAQNDVERLLAKGYPIDIINSNGNQATVELFNIDHFPTYVLIRHGKEIERHSGAVPAKQLAEMLNNAVEVDESQATFPENETLSSHLVGNEDQLDEEFDIEAKLEADAPKREMANDEKYAKRSNIPRDIDPKLLDRALRATVRFRIVDPQGTSHGSGTIIHVHGNEALVLTCGHIFRESKGTGEVYADIGFPDNPHTVRGQILKYDSDKHDVALVAIELDMAIEPIAIEQLHRKPLPRSTLFTVGCNRGDDPTIRGGKMMRVSKYDGIKKYDVSNRPIDGRSGGGLYTKTGKLVGVCNAADVNADEGIYAAMESVYWQFKTAGLIDMIEQNGQRQHDLNQFANNLSPKLVAGLSSSQAEQIEIDVTIRTSKGQDSITLKNPSPELLQLLTKNANSNEQLYQRYADQIKTIPRRRISKVAGQEIRTQSPR